MVSNSKYWMGPDIIAAKGLKSKVRDYGRVWDFDGMSAEICPIDWKGPKAVISPAMCAHGALQCVAEQPVDRDLGHDMRMSCAGSRRVFRVDHGHVNHLLWGDTLWMSRFDRNACAEPP